MSVREILEKAERVAQRNFPVLFKIERGHYLTDCVEMECAKKMYLAGYRQGHEMQRKR